MVKALAHHCHNTIEKIIHNTQTRRPLYKNSHISLPTAVPPTFQLLRVSDTCSFPPTDPITTPRATATTDTIPTLVQ
jgi:hypothetical protein